MTTTAADQTMAEIETFLSRSQADPLRSLRVTLRPLTLDDQDEYIERVRASQDLFHPWMSLPDTPHEFRSFVAGFDHSTAQGLKVCLRDGGAMAGWININSIVRGRFQCGTLAYGAFVPAAGHGYMSEGLGLVVRYAFEQLRLHRLEANIQPENRASRKLEGYAKALKKSSPVIAWSVSSNFSMGAR